MATAEHEQPRPAERDGGGGSRRVRIRRARMDEERGNSASVRPESQNAEHSETEVLFYTPSI